MVAKKKCILVFLMFIQCKMNLQFQHRSQGCLGNSKDDEAELLEFHFLPLSTEEVPQLT
jgi:hypothetical protein